MISAEIRDLAHKLAKTGDECFAGTITLLEASNKCTSLAIHFLSLAHQVGAMEIAAIPPEKRGLVLIPGGKQDYMQRNREPQKSR